MVVHKHGQLDFYREAQRRQAQPQPVVKHTASKSILLTAPNNIIFELFGTIIMDISSDRLMDYINKNLYNYLETNWKDKTTKRAVDRLRREQAVDVKAGLVDLPIIKSQSDSSKSPQKQMGSHKEESKIERQQHKQTSPPAISHKSMSYKPSDAVQQVHEHILWRIRTKNVTQITSLILKLALDFGYNQGKLKAELYDEVASCFEDWRQSKLIKLYAFGNAPADDQHLLLANTNHGDIAKWVANYIDGSEKRDNPDLIRKLASALRDKTKNCIFVTNDLSDALRSFQTESLRCAFVVDRKCRYEKLESVPNFTHIIQPLIQQGKLYIMSSLDCVQFAPDPTSSECC